MGREHVDDRGSVKRLRIVGRTIRLSWPARSLILRLRFRALLHGDDVAGAVLLLHHLAWVLVMLWPGPTLVPQTAGTRSSLRLFTNLGGDWALLAVYLPLLAITTVAVLRLTLNPARRHPTSRQASLPRPQHLHLRRGRDTTDRRRVHLDS